MITTTLRRITEQDSSTCEIEIKLLLKYLGKTKIDEEQLPYAEIVKGNGLRDALYCCRAEPQHSKEWRLFAVWCVRQIAKDLNESIYVDAIEIGENYAYGYVSACELSHTYKRVTKAIIYQYKYWPEEAVRSLLKEESYESILLTAACVVQHIAKCIECQEKRAGVSCKYLAMQDCNIYEEAWKSLEKEFLRIVQ